MMIWRKNATQPHRYDNEAHSYCSNHLCFTNMYGKMKNGHGTGHERLSCFMLRFYCAIVNALSLRNGYNSFVLCYSYLKETITVTVVIAQWKWTLVVRSLFELGLFQTTCQMEWWFWRKSFKTSTKLHSIQLLDQHHDIKWLGGWTIKIKMITSKCGAWVNAPF